MMTKIVTTVTSIWSWFVLATLIVIYTPIVGVVRLVTRPFDKGAYRAGYLFRQLTRVHAKLNPAWKFTTSGTLPDDMRRPYVAVCNHESFVDMLVISQLPTEFKYMTKVEIMKIPVLGWMMRFARDIPLTRGSKDSGRMALEHSRERLDNNVSVMVFPEGSRSKTGELGDFRAGAFKLAIDTQHPILPMVVHGTREALRKNDWRQNKATAELRVLDPISTEGLTVDDLDDLRARVRTIIEDGRDVLRAEHGYVPPAIDAAAPDTSEEQAS